MRPVTDPDWLDLAAGISLVATDLDGTLLRPDTTVSAFTVDTLARARAAGLPVVVVTGRPPRWIVPVAAATGHAIIGCPQRSCRTFGVRERMRVPWPAARMTTIGAFTRQSYPDCGAGIRTPT